MLFQRPQVWVDAYATRPLRPTQGIVQLEPCQMNGCMGRNQGAKFLNVGAQVVPSGTGGKHRNNLPNGHRGQGVFQIH